MHLFSTLNVTHLKFELSASSILTPNAVEYAPYIMGLRGVGTLKSANQPQVRLIKRSGSEVYTSV